jgi:hypothetical protein
MAYAPKVEQHDRRQSGSGVNEWLKKCIQPGAVNTPTLVWLVWKLPCKIVKPPTVPLR